WRERLFAYRLADGQRVSQRDVSTSRPDTDPTGLWSGGGALLSTSWEGRQVRAYRMPAVEDAGWPGRARPGSVLADSVPEIGDPALRAAIREALGKEPGESVTAGELAGLESLSARNSGVRELAGLEFATGLKELDLGFNPLADLRPLAALAALDSLNLDGAALDLTPLASLAGLRRLSVRHNLLDDLRPLAALTGLTELDIGDNHIRDLGPLAGLTRLEVLRADRNGIADLWPLASLADLEALYLGVNRVRDLQPLAGLERLRMLRLDGNRLSELHPLSGLKGLADLDLSSNAVGNLGALAGLDGLRRLDMRGTAVGDLRPLRGLASLAWVHVGGSRIEDLSPLDGLEGLTVVGRDDLEPPSAGGGRVQRSGSPEPDSAGR
ncbi:MAG: leucine-rich repeat domain-containing protein, partial [Bryobacterales bacterium]|nr:leucine-rich repeat domain-containing protein [Bryobacterales bacterium]